MSTLMESKRSVSDFSCALACWTASRVDCHCWHCLTSLATRPERGRRERGGAMEEAELVIGGGKSYRRHWRLRVGEETQR